jgi:uncharacterized membrane protein YphA (DoxX/SURF4 family)
MPELPAANRPPWSANTAQKSILVALRIAVGWHFLYEGVAKLYMPAWTSKDFLEVSRWIFSGAFHWVASHPAAVRAVDLLNMWGLTAIGLALMLGIFTRVAGLAGMLLLLLYWTANPPLVGLDFGMPAEGHYLVVNKNVVEFFAMAVLVLFPSGRFFGLDGLVRAWRGSREISLPRKEAGRDRKSVPASAAPVRLERREILKSLAPLPLLGAFWFALSKKKKWESWEEKNLVEAVTSASAKTANFAGLDQLKGKVPMAEVKGRKFSRLILGGNLLSGWAHSRDLIYVSDLVKAYHHKDKIFGTLLLAEKCGINTLLTNPILCTLIDDYWKRDIGKIQFISDCAGLNYDAKGASPMPYQEYIGRIKRAIDFGACGCYIQGETADYYMEHGRVDDLAGALELIRKNKVLVGIGAHRLSTLKACVKEGLETDFWMKTFHPKDYWSYRHPEWHDNAFCLDAKETVDFMKTRPEPWIAFKTMAAGAVHPKEGFRYAFESGADFVCAGMYDFQLVEDVNIALDTLNGGLKRERAWRV